MPEVVEGGYRVCTLADIVAGDGEHIMTLDELLEGAMSAVEQFMNERGLAQFPPRVARRPSMYIESFEGTGTLADGE